MTVIKLFEEPVYLFHVVGIDDLEGTTFATCTTQEYAEKAVAMIQAAGIENITIIQDTLAVNTIEINDEIIDLTEYPPLLHY